MCRRNYVFYYFSYVLGMFLNFIFLSNEILRLKKINFFMSSQICSILDPINKGFVSRVDYDVIEKKKVSKVILAIPSFGCSYYFKTGGCSMCGFNKEIKDFRFREMHEVAIYVLVKVFILNLEYKTQNQKHFSLAVFMAGSFINEEELSVRGQDYVLNFFARSKFKKLILESRPELVIENNERLLEIKKKIEPKELKINVGFEAVNDKIRNEYIRKGVSLSVFTSCLRFLKKHRVFVGAYILVGSPYLTEEEIAEESIKSVRYAWENGVDVVNLEVYCVQEDTPWEKLFYEKKLVIPSLWSILKILKEIDKVSSNWYLGKFDDWPPPVAVPKGCAKCNDRVMKVLDDIRKNHNISISSQLPLCNCNL